MTFSELGLPEALVTRLASVGYEAPSPIQAATIPALMQGRDVLGTAQTGTGKTAAFALPAIARLRPNDNRVQVLVLTPTRELAIQVAEAFQTYATEVPGFRVLPIYGGQPYGPQLQGLRRGVQVVVGTPGRVKDHLERGTLSLDAVQAVVLDEADEMLRMGFVEEVDIILSRAPATRQVALFSATMPSSVRRIAQTHLKDPVEVNIAAKTRTAADVNQRYWYVAGTHKMEALTRILEAETFDAMIIFARTKAMTTELAEKLQARGFAAAALNGDMPQSERERTVERLKNRQLDIAVATDVAARGLDVERISHVLNYDIPTDTESYIHRIGRTGRAGRSGEAILFVAPREKHLLRLIEKATRQPITEMRLPTVAAVNAKRMDKFKQSIADTLASGGSDAFRPILEDMVREQGVSLLDIACALAAKAQGKTPLLMSPDAEIAPRPPQRDDAPARPAHARPAGSMLATSVPISRAPVRAVRRTRLKKAWHAIASRWAVSTAYSPGRLSAPLPMRPTSTVSTSVASKSPRTTAWSTCQKACPSRYRRCLPRPGFAGSACRFARLKPVMWPLRPTSRSSTASPSRSTSQAANLTSSRARKSSPSRVRRVRERDAVGGPSCRFQPAGRVLLLLLRDGRGLYSLLGTLP